jgi:hypothetical protein
MDSDLADFLAKTFFLLVIVIDPKVRKKMVALFSDF